VKRETRVNLWFLAVFLVLSLPGAVILFRKKLDPTASRMDQPDAVLSRMPFMAPPPVPPGVRWMVPTATRAWLAELTREKAGTAMASTVTGGPEWEPIISADHRLQVMSVSTANDATVAALLLWHGWTSTEASNYLVYADIGSREEQGTIESVEPVPIPPDVRKELVSLGYTHPPKQVLWMRARWPGALTNGQTVDLALTGWSSPPLRSLVEWDVK
jgi:hypothetical protein